MFELPAGLVDAVLARLGVAAPSTADHAGLARVYAAWCQAIPFDNVLKRLWLEERWPGRLPGSTPVDFFRDWLEYRTGGTCWAGNGALFALLRALGFRVELGAATMMSAPDTPGPNHGTVVVSLAEGRFVADASILSGAPLRLPEPGEIPPPPAALPAVQVVDGRTVILWRTVRQPEGFTCRIDRIGLAAGEWDALHQHTATWSPFNFATSARLNRGADVIGYGAGLTYRIRPDGTLEAQPAGRDAMVDFLAEILEIDAAVAARLPEDRPVPPRPDGFAPPAAAGG
ncbi:MAG TPA: arylamine N-acetyltransferase [Kofleriaceae bacterium]|nr:arylamine N-acetyltransferase [Kofleriaceae bacterium]